MVEHRGRRPVVPGSAHVAPTAVLCGAVVLGERSRVLHGAVLTGEGGEVWVGSDVAGTSMREVMARQVGLYGTHQDDVTLDGPA
ncbi:hypothetical protein ACFU3E_19240 [Streptomyces sp. NPDC057424]|uniref:hypothetical protein n=1 Tax=Streptomyces sp. NPDC057424 TaxID=3346127 RepID=UPI0036A8F00D